MEISEDKLDDIVKLTSDGASMGEKDIEIINSKMADEEAIKNMYESDLVRLKSILILHLSRFIFWLNNVILLFKC